jgi:hypothetical protein
VQSILPSIHPSIHQSIMDSLDALSSDDMKWCKLFFSDLKITKKNSTRGCTCQSCGVWLPWNDFNDNSSLIDHLKLNHPSYQSSSEPEIAIKSEPVKCSRKESSSNCVVVNSISGEDITATCSSIINTQDSETTAEIITGTEPSPNGSVLKRQDVLVWGTKFTFLFEVINLIIIIYYRC